VVGYHRFKGRYCFLLLGATKLFVARVMKNSGYTTLFFDLPSKPCVTV